VGDWWIIEGNVFNDGLEPWALHHTGLLVASISQVAPSLARSLRTSWNERIIHDPQQQARVSFLYPSAGAPGAGCVELVEPDGEDSPAHKLLTRTGGGLYHLCYEVARLDAQVESSYQAGDLILQKPIPAVAFGGRRIAWVYTRSKLLLEFLER
jgi:methylmalonyl-CoA/ethylmalonyl-CoA epimerase